uniref:NADH-ubiquinone oxidoreductase chain 2 n=1 Tax=Tympanocryptis pinguicolla TaxID=206610 RepID=A1XQL6_9SAUR|nr:NADH dehydrogenase subunit 2 [Tympanocryptis pinguicolla]ABG25132.1 NADH dehydrogenase subunit 2 [Tympanocryptis pinguicolla]
MPSMASFMVTLGITLGTLTVTSANHWLTAWLGLELNMISILPVIAKQKHPRSTEAATKYFLTQATASALMLFASTMNAWQTGSWDITQLNNKLSCTLMIIALAMKMGVAPTHFWLPEVMQGSTLATALLITTWQKVAPITLLYTISNHTEPIITLFIGLLSILIGGWGGFNQTQLRKMMAYSSIAHLGWTMTIISISPNIALTNIIIYMIMSAPFFMLLMTTTSKTLQTMTTTWTHAPTTTIILMLLLLSMAGLPPLTGFTPKLLILDNLVTHKLALTASIMALLSLLSLTFYLRTTYLLTSTASPITTQSTTLWRLKPHQNQITTILTPIALFNITMMPALLI